jgi:hypothetical protein
MIAHCFTITALVALSYARAIITNNCKQPIYLWSVPNGVENLELLSGVTYNEPWRHGTEQQPGIALKVSTVPQGIYTGANELNFAYSYDHVVSRDVWVGLSTVRGDTFKDAIFFHTPTKIFTSADVVASRCEYQDDVKLVLCGSAPSVVTKSEAAAPVRPSMISRV